MVFADWLQGFSGPHDMTVGELEEILLLKLLDSAAQEEEQLTAQACVFVLKQLVDTRAQPRMPDRFKRRMAVKAVYTSSNIRNWLSRAPAPDAFAALALKKTLQHPEVTVELGQQGQQLVQLVEGVCRQKGAQEVRVLGCSQHKADVCSSCLQQV
jgi:hypothetical protein